MASPKKNEKKDRSYLLGFIFLLLSAFFVFLFLLPDGKKGEVANKNPQSKQFEEKVNKYLFQTSQQMELNRQKAQIEANDLEAKGLGKPTVKDDVHHLDLSTDPRAEALLRELGRDVKDNGAPMNADEQVQAELFQEQENQEYSEAYKKEYARQFVENARKAGYIIKLNDDYKVISISPIRKPADNLNIFQGQSSGAK